jgi:Ca2+-binding EF-hand superfamily protein
MADVQSTTGILTGRRDELPDAALQITAQTNWGYVWYSLSELYATGGPLMTEDIALTEDVAVWLDEDSDGIVSEKELERLHDVSPHVTVQADFGEPGGRAGISDKRVQLRDVSPHVETIGLTPQCSGQRVAISLPDARVLFFATEDPMLYNAPVSAVDVNRDGQVADYEVARFLQRRQDSVGGLVRAWVAGHEDPLFAALDADGDGLLSARELGEASERLTALDQNTDGRLETHEIPQALVVGLIRGNPLRDDELMALPSAGGAADRSTARWFAAMDSNHDGEISRREFLGNAAQFQQLDRDADEFIRPDEAAHAQSM